MLDVIYVDMKYLVVGEDNENFYYIKLGEPLTM